MKKTICDRCGAEAEGRNNGFSERLIEGSTYIDLCPSCVKEFDKVRAAAAATYNATITAYLKCVTQKGDS